MAGVRKPTFTGRQAGVAIFIDRTDAVDARSAPRDGLPRRLEGIVVGVGALMCAIGSWFAHKFYKGEKLPFELLAPPSAAEEAAMLSGGKANVPITPDVAYTGKG